MKQEAVWETRENSSGGVQEGSKSSLWNQLYKQAQKEFPELLILLKNKNKKQL